MDTLISLYYRNIGDFRHDLPHVDPTPSRFYERRQTQVTGESHAMQCAQMIASAKEQGYENIIPLRQTIRPEQRWAFKDMKDRVLYMYIP